jgi:hypothetical protein
MFGFGRCRGCEAREQEVKHLMGQLERLNGMLEKSHARVVEIAAPGAHTRALIAEREPKPRITVEPPPTFPGYMPAKPKETIEVE